VKGFEDYNVYTFPEFNVGKEIKSYSGVLRWPRKLVRLPEGMDVSAFMNASSNFTPLGSRLDYFGNVTPSPEGKTLRIRPEPLVLQRPPHPPLQSLRNLRRPRQLHRAVQLHQRHRADDRLLDFRRQREPKPDD